MDRREDYKKTIDIEDGRKKREDASTILRKKKREERYASKRRQATTEDMTHVDPATFTALMHALQEPGEKAAKAARLFRLALRANDDGTMPIQEVIDCGALPHLIRLASTAGVSQIDAGWALTNMCSRESRFVNMVVSAGGVEAFTAMVNTGGEAAAQGLWGLSNIAGESTDFRNHMIHSGIIDFIARIPITADTGVKILQNLSFLVSNLCRGRPRPPFDATLPIVPIIIALMGVDDTDTLTDALWAMSYYTDDESSNSRIGAALNQGVLPALGALINTQDSSALVRIITIIGNIVTGSHVQTQMVLDSNFLPFIHNCMQSGSRLVRKNAYWAISNISAGTHSQIQHIMDILPHMVQKFTEETHMIKCEMIWTIANCMTAGNIDQKQYTALHCMDTIGQSLTMSDPRINMTSLNALRMMLELDKRVDYANAVRQFLSQTSPHSSFALHFEASGGLDHLEALQEHVNQDVYALANKTIVDYFDCDDDEALPVNEYGNAVFTAGMDEGFNF